VDDDDFVPVPGLPFAVRRSKLERMQLEGRMPGVRIEPAPRHGLGDPDGELPGDRPEAFDPGLSDEDFERRFTGSMGDIARITTGNGEQIHGERSN
jgi:hypothetical protein